MTYLSKSWYTKGIITFLCVVSLLPYVSSTYAQGGLITHCAIEKTFAVTGSPVLSLLSSEAATTSAIKTTTPPANSKQVMAKQTLFLSSIYPAGFRLSTSGSAVAFISKIVKKGSPVTQTINVIVGSGKVLSIPAPAPIVQIGPEATPGHFQLLGYVKGNLATLFDLAWSSDSLSITESRQLPFKLGLSLALLDNLTFISQDWKWIAYTESPNLSIFSLETQRVVWQTRYLGRIPQIIWALRGNDVAIVSLGGTDSDGKLFMIDKNGQQRLLIDLPNVTGKDVQLSNYPEAMSSGSRLPLGLRTVVNGVQYPPESLYVLDTSNSTLTDVCLTFPNAVSNLDLTADGKYTMFQTLKDVKEADGVHTYPDVLTFINLQTSEYTRLYPTTNGKIGNFIDWVDVQ